MKEIVYSPLFKHFPKVHFVPKSDSGVGWWIRAIAKARGGRIVILTDLVGTRYATIARAYRDGKVRAPVFWSVFQSCEIGEVELLEEGSTTGPSSYITSWRFA